MPLARVLRAGFTIAEASLVLALTSVLVAGVWIVLLELYRDASNERLVKDFRVALSAFRGLAGGHRLGPLAPAMMARLGGVGESAALSRLARNLAPERMTPDYRPRGQPHLRRHISLDGRIPVTVGRGGLADGTATDEVRDQLGLVEGDDTVMVVRIGLGGYGDSKYGLDQDECHALLSGAYRGLVGVTVRLGGAGGLAPDNIRTEPASATPAAVPGSNRAAGGPFTDRTVTLTPPVRPLHERTDRRRLPRAARGAAHHRLHGLRGLRGWVERRPEGYAVFGARGPFYPLRRVRRSPVGTASFPPQGNSGLSHAAAHDRIAPFDPSGRFAFSHVVSVPDLRSSPVCLRGLTSPRRAASSSRARA